MPNRIEARSAKAALTNATGRLPLLRLFSTPQVCGAPLKGASPRRVKVPPGSWFAPPGSNQSGDKGNEV